MALRPVMLLQNIIDQILMEQWKEKQPSCKQIMIATVAMHHIVEEKDIVESQQKHSKLKGLFASAMIGAKVMLNAMPHLCSMHMTRTKLLLGKDMQSRVIHLIPAFHHHPMQSDTESNMKKLTTRVVCQTGQRIICMARIHPAIWEMDSKT